MPLRFAKYQSNDIYDFYDEACPEWKEGTREPHLSARPPKDDGGDWTVSIRCSPKLEDLCKDPMKYNFICKSCSGKFPKSEAYYANMIKNTASYGDLKVVIDETTRATKS